MYLHVNKITVYILLYILYMFIYIVYSRYLRNLIIQTIYETTRQTIITAQVSCRIPC